MFSWQKCFQNFSKQHRLSFNKKCVLVELDPSTFSYKQWLFYVPHPNRHQVCLMVFLLIEWAYINLYNKKNLPSYASKWNNSSNLILSCRHPFLQTRKTPNNQALIPLCWERLPNAIVLKTTFPFLCAKNRFNKQLS